MTKNNLNLKEYLEKSRHPEIDLPRFQSTIPEDLLEDKDEIEKLLYNSINIQNQQLNWLIEVTLKNNRQLRITNGRVNVLEDWKRVLTSG